MQSVCRCCDCWQSLVNKSKVNIIDIFLDSAGVKKIFNIEGCFVLIFSIKLHEICGLIIHKTLPQFTYN